MLVLRKFATSSLLVPQSTRTLAYIAGSTSFQNLSPSTFGGSDVVTSNKAETTSFVVRKNRIVRNMSSSAAPFTYNTYDSLPSAPAFEVTSSDITEGGTMPSPQLSKAFGVEGGEDVSPQLSWKGFDTDATKSFAVTCYDPDAPTVSGFWHWIVYDIPADVTSLVTDAGNPDKSKLPKGAKMLKNDAGFAGFCGAAPPPGHGSHRYIFCVSALPMEKLPIDESTTPAVCHFNMFGAGVVGRAFLTATYGR